MKCYVKNCDNLYQYELHHIIPKSVGGSDSDVRIYLCKKNHDIIHKFILSWIFDLIPSTLVNQIKTKIHLKTKYFQFFNKN